MNEYPEHVTLSLSLSLAMLPLWRAFSDLKALALTILTLGLVTNERVLFIFKKLLLLYGLLNKLSGNGHLKKNCHESEGTLWF